MKVLNENYYIRFNPNGYDIVNLSGLGDFVYIGDQSDYLSDQVSGIENLNRSPIAILKATGSNTVFNFVDRNASFKVVVKTSFSDLLKSFIFGEDINYVVYPNGVEKF